MAKCTVSEASWRHDEVMQRKEGRRHAKCHGEVMHHIVGRDPRKCPLYPQERTFSEAAWMSAKCHKRTFGVRAGFLLTASSGRL